MGREKKIDDVSIVIDAAMGIIDQFGYSKLSTRKIAAKLRISPMTLYNYYKNRGAILKGIIDRGFDELWIGLQDKLDACSTAGNPLRLFLVLADHMLNFGLTRPNIYRFLFASEVSQFPGNDAIAERYLTISTTVLPHITNPLKEKDILNDIYMFEVLMNSLVISVLDGKAQMTAERYPALISRAYEALLLRDEEYIG